MAAVGRSLVVYVVPARSRYRSTNPTAAADANDPIVMASCWYFGVAPRMCPVLSAWAVLPPFDEAMHTTPAIIRAVSLISLPMCSTPAESRTTRMRQVSKRVATVIPEIGLDDDPISPVSRADTVTNKDPDNGTTPAPASQAAYSPSPSCGAAASASPIPRLPNTTPDIGRSRSVRGFPAA